MKEGDTFTVQDTIGDSFIFSSDDGEDSLLDCTIKSKKPKMEYVGCFDEERVDTCEIYYADLISLEIQGILHINNIEHLKCVPDFFLLQEQYLMNAIRTLVGNEENKEILLESLPSKFNKWVQRELLVFYEFYNDFGLINTQLFQKYPEYFEITLDVNPKLKVKQGGLFAWKYPIEFPKDYFATPLKSTTVALGSTTDNPIVIDDEPMEN